ncbi:hypothetical protein H0H81_004894 [Sphagnurus paluster]|uniref:SET domain-containing protein n=1 Tax=Sphagnurus paluster TaxID=117069 RepID=A0A9P7FW34_9AGAR|nr:hypothetical protein H0H81_004894 [Sphagnurus paluster]
MPTSPSPGPHWAHISEPASETESQYSSPDVDLLDELASITLKRKGLVSPHPASPKRQRIDTEGHSSSSLEGLAADRRTGKEKGKEKAFSSQPVGPVKKRRAPPDGLNGSNPFASSSTSTSPYKPKKPSQKKLREIFRSPLKLKRKPSSAQNITRSPLNFIDLRTTTFTPGPQLASSSTSRHTVTSPSAPKNSSSVVSRMVSMYEAGAKVKRKPPAPISTSTAISPTKPKPASTSTSTSNPNPSEIIEILSDSDDTPPSAPTPQPRPSLPASKSAPLVARPKPMTVEKPASSAGGSGGMTTSTSTVKSNSASVERNMALNPTPLVRRETARKSCGGPPSSIRLHRPAERVGAGSSSGSGSGSGGSGGEDSGNRGGGGGSGGGAAIGKEGSGSGPGPTARPEVIVLDDSDEAVAPSASTSKFKSKPTPIQMPKPKTSLGQTSVPGARFLPLSVREPPQYVLTKTSVTHSRALPPVFVWDDDDDEMNLGPSRVPDKGKGKEKEREKETPVTNGKDKRRSSTSDMDMDVDVDMDAGGARGNVQGQEKEKPPHVRRTSGLRLDMSGLKDVLDTEVGGADSAVGSGAMRKDKDMSRDKDKDKQKKREGEPASKGNSNSNSSKPSSTSLVDAITRASQGNFSSSSSVRPPSRLKAKAPPPPPPAPAPAQTPNVIDLTLDSSSDGEGEGSSDSSAGAGGRARSRKDSSMVFAESRTLARLSEYAALAREGKGKGKDKGKARDEGGARGELRPSLVGRVGTGTGVASSPASASGSGSGSGSGLGAWASRQGAAAPRSKGPARDKDATMAPPPVPPRLGLETASSSGSGSENVGQTPTRVPGSAPQSTKACSGAGPRPQPQEKRHSLPMPLPLLPSTTTGSPAVGATATTNAAPAPKDASNVPTSLDSASATQRPMPLPPPPVRRASLPGKAPVPAPAPNPTVPIQVEEDVIHMLMEDDEPLPKLPSPTPSEGAYSSSPELMAQDPGERGASRTPRSLSDSSKSGETSSRGGTSDSSPAPPTSSILPHQRARKSARGLPRPGAHIGERGESGNRSGSGSGSADDSGDGSANGSASESASVRRSLSTTGIVATTNISPLSPIPRPAMQLPVLRALESAEADSGYAIERQSPPSEGDDNFESEYAIERLSPPSDELEYIDAPLPAPEPEVVEDVEVSVFFPGSVGPVELTWFCSKMKDVEQLLTSSGPPSPRSPIAHSESESSADPLDSISDPLPYHRTTRSSCSNSDEPANFFGDESTPSTPFESPVPSPSPPLDPSLPVPTKLYGGYASVSWASYRADPTNFRPRVHYAADLPHAQQDAINALPESLQRNPVMARILESTIQANTAFDEPDAPPIEVVNTVDNDPTPPWEFYYSNAMWHGKDVPPPHVEGLVSCGCRGRCDPKSKKCACIMRQQEERWKAHEVTQDFMYSATGKLKSTGGYPVFECNDMCGCGDECRNRVVQHGRKCAIRIQKTEEKGWGVFAGNKKIPAGTYLGIYAGELLTEKEAEERGKNYNKSGRTYLFDIDVFYLKPEDDPGSWNVKYVVDAYHAGNFTRFLNHSCDANAQIVPVYVNEANIDKPFLAVFSGRDIEAFEEICFSYLGGGDEDDDDKGSPSSSRGGDAVYQQCACKAANCTGKMFK